jgi:hypothetical protein
VIAACVLGGVSLLGGIATIEGLLAGVLIMGTVQNVLNLLNVETFYQYVSGRHSDHCRPSGSVQATQPVGGDAVMELQAHSPWNHPSMDAGDQPGRIRGAFRRPSASPPLMVRSPAA